MPPKKKEIEILEPSVAAEALAAKYPNIRSLRPVPQRTEQSQCLKSPSTQLNILLGDGGFRPGSIVEQYGPEGTLKTWLALEMCREAQMFHPGLSTAFFDLEQRVDRYVASTLIGVNLGSLDNGFPRFEYFPEFYEEIPSLEGLLNRVHDYVLSGLFSIIVIDSVAAAMPLVEINSEDITHTQQMGAPLIMSKSFRKLGPVCSRTGTILWLVNQMRTSITMSPRGPISKKEPTGGMALKFAATHRLRTEWMEKEKEHDTSNLHILTEKVKYGPDQRTASIPIVFGAGIDKQLDLLRAASTHGIVVKKGSWYDYQGKNLAQGEEKTSDLLRESPELFLEIESATYKAALN